MKMALQGNTLKIIEADNGAMVEFTLGSYESFAFYTAE